MPNNLFTISKISSDGNKHIFSVTVDATSHILKGHFEGQPVVPGVCTLTMVKQSICVALQRDRVQYESIKECKFLAAIIPSEHPQLSVNIEFKTESEVMVVVSCGEQKMMKLKAVIA